MTEKDPITPKGYVQEFIEVLKAEIEELKQSKDNNIILMNGILFESKNGTNLQLSRNVMLERIVPFFIFYIPSFDI